MSKDTERYPVVNPPGLGPDRNPSVWGKAKMTQVGNIAVLPSDAAARRKEVLRHRLERAARGPSSVVERFVAEYQNELHEDDHVLEVGVGEGRNLKPFAELGKNLRLYGIDDKRNAVDLCRKLLAEQGIKADILQGNFTELPYADGSMKIVVSHAALQNAKAFEDARRAFAEIARVLKSGGLYLFRENRTPRLKYADRLDRIAYFTENEVQRLAEENGFIIERGEEPFEGDADADRVGGKRIIWETVFRKPDGK